MNICLVSQQFPPETARGGIGTLTWTTAHGLARLGHTVHVLSHTGDRVAATSTPIDGGVIVHRMASPWEGLPLHEDAVWWVGYT